MAGNTGYVSYANLELYYPDDNSAAGETKSNVFGTVGYIAPVYNSTTCVPSARFYNVQLTESATKNDCGGGQVGSSVTMTATANSFVSEVSQFQANAQAVNYLTSNVQAYANNLGTCTAPSDTTAPTTPFLNSLGDFGNGFLRVGWTVSTDASGIAYYEVYRAIDNGILAVVAQVSIGTIYDDYDVFNGNLYSYTIRAVDTSFNQSNFSNTESYFY
jgi:hypothetical protein